MAQDTKRKMEEIIIYIKGNKGMLDTAKDHVKAINDPELTKKFDTANAATDDVVKYIESRIDHK